MLATPITIQTQRPGGLRPINLGTDLRQVLKLLDASFGPLADSDGRRLLDDRVNISYHVPLSTRLSMFTQGFVPGFVWEEDGRIAGNVSLLRSDVSGRYLIANVAVHPDYRRRGMARAMMNGAVDHIRSQQGKEIALQVEHDNDGAISLYLSLGFVNIGTMNRWDSTTSRLRLLSAGTDDEEAVIRPLNRGDWKAAINLDRTSIDPSLSWPAPPSPEKYRIGLRRTLSDLFNGKKTESWVCEDHPSLRNQPRLVGLISLRGEWNRPHEIDLRVDPGWQGRLERPLLAHGLRRLKRWHRGRVVINHPADDSVVHQLLNEANFQVKRTLSVMYLDLRPPA